MSRTRRAERIEPIAAVRGRSRTARAAYLVAIACAALELAAPATARGDALTEAQALFDQGIADLQAGRVELACRELAASLAKHEDSGTKGALATCEEQRGRTATAWRLWKDLADTAPSPALRDDAARRAAALAPRLARYSIQVAAPIPGLVITVNGAAVDWSLGVALPTDPGALAIDARAPGHRAWSSRAQARAGEVTRLEVPALIAAPAPAATGAETAEPPRRWRGPAIALTASGGALLATSLALGAAARSAYDDVRRACGGALDACPGDRFAEARRTYDKAHDRATLSTIAFVGGAVAAAGGIALLIAAPRERAGVAWHVAPAITADGGGVALGGAW